MVRTDGASPCWATGWRNTATPAPTPSVGIYTFWLIPAVNRWIIENTAFDDADY
jgi:hypothetical protein